MADATVTRTITLADPNTEVVVLTVSDNEDYRSKKFKTITAAHISANMTSGQYTEETFSVSYSGQIATIQIQGSDTSDVLATLTLHGEQ